MLPFLLVFLAILALFYLGGLPIDAIRDRNKVANYENDRTGWVNYMEEQFVAKYVPPEKRTTVAIQEGLKSSPDLQQAMVTRLNEYLSFIYVNSSLEVTYWPWLEFEEDLARVADAGKEIHIQGIFVSAKDTWNPVEPVVSDITENEIHVRGIHIPRGFSSKEKILRRLRPVHDQLEDLIRVADTVKEINIQGTLVSAEDAWNAVETAVSDITENGIHLPDIHIPIGFPSKEEILRRLRPIRDQLDHIIRDESSQAEEVLRKIEEFVSVQVKLLPDRVQHAVEEFNKYRHDHPYIVAAVTITLVIVGTELIIPRLAIFLLRSFGFGPLGPTAGSWAPAIQSAVYGARTRGVFSILQHVTMTSKRIWPASVFLDLVALAAGAIVGWQSHEVKDAVDAWYSELTIPDLNLLAQSDPAALEMLHVMMQDLGRKCEEVGMPAVQWLDAELHLIYRKLEEMDISSAVV